jgi:hypothetical protein
MPASLARGVDTRMVSLRLHQISADVLPAAHQITQPPPLERRDRHQRQFAGGQQPREPDRVALVGVDPIPGRRSVRPGALTVILIPRARARRASP